MNINQEIEAHWDKNGDGIKFKKKASESYDVIRGALTKYAFGRLRSWQDAEDAVQDAYIHVLTYPPQGDGHNFGGLYKLYLDRSIAAVRAARFNRAAVEEEDDIEESKTEGKESSDLLPDQALDLVGQTNLIMDMSNILKPKAKAIVRLALIFGYSYREIEKITKADTDTVRNTLTYFRKKIKENPEYENLCG